MLAELLNGVCWPNAGDLILASIDVRRAIELHLQEGRSFGTAFTALWGIPPVVGWLRLEGVGAAQLGLIAVMTLWLLGRSPGLR